MALLRVATQCIGKNIRKCAFLVKCLAFPSRKINFSLIYFFSARTYCKHYKHSSIQIRVKKFRFHLDCSIWKISFFCMQATWNEYLKIPIKIPLKLLKSNSITISSWNVLLYNSHCMIFHEYIFTAMQWNLIVRNKCGAEQIMPSLRFYYIYIYILSID